MIKKTRKAADLFCGAGGTSSGLMDAANARNVRLELTAINHWPVAVQTHQANHPEARHLCASVDNVNPRHYFGEGELDLLWASPECTNHSIARGGKPINDQSRATAMCVVRWAEATLPKVILVENVKEFLNWGPLIKKNGEYRPDPKRLGETFRAWKGMLEAIGYRVEHRILCAADYGDPTTRRRLFVAAVRGGRKWRWPEATHAQKEERDLFGGSREAWVAAREIIDWSDLGLSVFKRKRPLAEKTMRRIMIGLDRYAFEAFIVPQQRGGRPIHSVDDPLPIIATAGAHALCRPFLVKLRGTGTVCDVDEPSPALTAGGNHLGVAYLIQTNHGNGIDKDGDARRVREITKPLATIAGNRGEWGVVIAIDHAGGNGNQVFGVDEPVSTVTTKQRHALARPYLIKFYGKGGAASVDAPLDTVRTKDCFGLCQPSLEIDGERYLIDILFRMLRPRELARAQSFPDNYQFLGTTTQVVKQIGNSVPRKMAGALGGAALEAM